VQLHGQRHRRGQRRAGPAAALADHVTLGRVEEQALGADGAVAASAPVEPRPVAEEIEKPQGEGQLHPGRRGARVEGAESPEQ